MNNTINKLQVFIRNFLFVEISIFDISTVKKLSLLTALITLAGCQTTPKLQSIPPNIQTNLVTLWTTTETCYNHNFYTLDEHTSYQQAINYSFSTWKFDSKLIASETNNLRTIIQKNISKGSNVSSTCKQWKPSMVQTVNSATNHYNQVQRNIQRNHEIQRAKASAPKVQSSSSSSTWKKTVNCKKMGQFLNAEIKTFQGTFCPIGWVSA